MTPTDLYTYWNSHFGDSLPIAHYLKVAYPDRWFRIHSLPESKRYAHNEQERNIILERQNTLITDILADSPFYLITGEYVQKDEEVSAPFVEEDSAYCKIPFNKLDSIDLDELDWAYESGLYHPYISNQKIWQYGCIDDILLSIAEDESRAFILSVEHTCIIAPYDGGVDIILQNETLRDIYKAKYAAWLSARPDGL